MPRRQKLELTWIGKEKRPRLEPRILLEDPEHSHHAEHRVTEKDHFDNILIHGDNLLALKALEADYAGKVKCIYIDPPFNTGEAFEHYDDGVEHSVWLSLMRDRIEILHQLLSEDGSMFVHIDDNELGYLIVLMDEIFGRSNRISVITFRQSAVSGPKAQNPGVVSTSSFVLYYAKDKAHWDPHKVYVPTDRDDRYNHLITNYESPFEEWQFSTLREVLGDRLGMNPRRLPAELGESLGELYGLEKREQKRLGSFVVEQMLRDLVMENTERVIRPARVQPKDVNQDAREVLIQSINDPDRVYRSERDDLDDYYFKGGQQLLFYSNKVHDFGGEKLTGHAASTIWTDLFSNNLHKEGGVRFPKGKKPEALLKRLLELATDPGDLVLDSFAGSGTTGAVAHKMGRRWIMVELGDHAFTHIVPRLTRVVHGEDDSGVTKATSWFGGGGFRMYRLAPSLMKKDTWGQWVVNPDYNAEMLAEALCKHEGFAYAPSDEHFWMHGHSTESDFVYVTTQTLTVDQLRFIVDEVGPDRTLLVLCAAWRGDETDFPNLTLKKIPNAVLDRCEWNRDDYSLNVAELPPAPPDPDRAPTAELPLFNQPSETTA